MERPAASWDFLERELGEFHKICLELERGNSSPPILPTVPEETKSELQEDSVAPQVQQVKKKQPPRPPPRKPKPALLPKPNMAGTK